MVIVLIAAAGLWGVAVLAIGARTDREPTGPSVAEIKDRIDEENAA